MWVERALDPVRAMVTDTLPEIQQQMAQRNALCVDYDAYRRRLATLQANVDKIPPNDVARAQKHETDTVETTAKLERAESNVACSHGNASPTKMSEHAV